MSAKVAPSPQYIGKTNEELMAIFNNERRINNERRERINQRARYASFGSNEPQYTQGAKNRFDRFYKDWNYNPNNLKVQTNALRNPTNPQRRNAARTAKKMYGNDAYKRLLNTIPQPKKKSWLSSRKTRRNKKRLTRKRK